MKNLAHLSIHLILVTLFVMLALAACAGQPASTAPTSVSGIGQSLTGTPEFTRSGSNVTRVPTDGAGSMEPRPSQAQPAASQAEPAQVEQPAQTATPIQVVVIQPAQTGIPVTGTSSPTGTFPWIFMFVSGLIVLLMLALYARRQPETSPSAVAEANNVTLTSTPPPFNPFVSSPADAPVDSTSNPANPPPILYEYQSGMPTIPPSDAPAIYDRSYLITIEVNRTSTMCNGVLFAMGSSQEGYGMYVKDNQLIFVQSREGVPRQLVSVIPVPIGSSTLQYRFIRTGSYQGTGTLYINSLKANSTFFEQTIPAPPSEGMNIGLDSGAPLTDAYLPPFPFEGLLNRVAFEVEVL